MRRPAPWIALLPLLLIPCCWLWWAGGSWNPGVQPSRSAMALLVAGAILAFRLLPGLPLPAAAMPMLFALAWSAATQAWSPIPEPGLGLLITRAAALATALGLAAWLVRRPDERMAPALGLAGLGILAMDIATTGDLGLVLRIGKEAPFGNVNYAVHAAMPLLLVGIVYLLRTSRRHGLQLALAGVAVCTVLATGVFGGSPCRAVVLLGLAAGSAMLILAAPRRWHGPALAVCAGLLGAAWIAAFAGALDPAALDTGTAQRIYMWRASCEALAGPQALVGHGPGSALAVLPGQPSFAGFWLSWECWASHPHNEYFNVLLEGGVVLAGLLSWAAWATLRPLWTRRDEPLCAALLVGWITVACGLLVEGHMHEPSGMLAIALLAGLSWSCVPATGESLRLPPWLLLLPAIAVALVAGRELLGDGGAPVAIHHRTMQRVQKLDAEGQLAELDGLRRRLGPLDTVDFARAHVLGRLARIDESMAVLAGHLRRLPCEPHGLRLAAQLRKAGRASPELRAAEAEARRLAAAWIDRVPHREINQVNLDALRKILADGGPDPAR